jgi:hypothetical protein
MIILINKLLAIFQLKLVSTKPVDLVKESVKFLNTLSPDDLCADIGLQSLRTRLGALRGTFSIINSYK